MRSIVLSLTLIILLTAVVSAEVILSQPNSIYNLGESVSITATVASSSNIDGFFQLFLICSGSEKEFYRQYIILTAGDEKTIVSEILLKEDTIGNIIGTCKIKGKFNEQYSLTQEFIVSDKTIISALIEKETFNPEEGIIIKGLAVKENSQTVNGFVELKIPEKQISTSGVVNDGNFALNFSFPKNTKSQIYTLELTVYEKDSSGKRINEGKSQLALTINQIPTTLDVEIGSSEIEPGNSIKFTPKLFDQAGDPMIAAGVYTIKDPNEKIIDQIKSDAGTTQEYYIANGSKAGLWKIFAVAYKITNEKTFKVLEKEDAYMELKNSTLYLKNIGNIPYTKKILVKVGEESYNIETNLDVGEEKEFNLNKLGAPGGEHSIKVSDGTKELTGNILLTGKTVSSSSENKSSESSSQKYSPLLWLLLILLIGGLGFFGYQQIRKRKIFGIEEKKDNIKTKKGLELKGEELDFSTGKIKKAEYSPTIKGESHTSIVVCLKLKNFQEITKIKGGNIKETLEEINNKADANKAVLYENHEFLFYMFLPTITKTVKNGKAAISLSQEIKNILNKHNKFFKQRIEYGLSLNLGETISKIEKNIVKFTATGDILTTAKKISEISNEEPLLSQKLREKVMSDIKTEKFEKGPITAYKITEIINRDNKFIGEFLKRNQDKKLNEKR